LSAQIYIVEIYEQSLQAVRKYSRKQYQGNATIFRVVALICGESKDALNGKDA
jgi:hypothetical protein